MVFLCVYSGAIKSSKDSDRSSGSSMATGGGLVGAMKRLEISASAERSADTENRTSHPVPRSELWTASLMSWDVQCWK